MPVVGRKAQLPGEAGLLAGAVQSLALDFRSRHGLGIRRLDGELLHILPEMLHRADEQFHVISDSPFCLLLTVKQE